MPFVDLKAQYQSIKKDIDGAIEKVVSEAAFVGGRFVKEFEVQFAQMLEIDHCIGVGNGTDAIYVTLRALEIGRGDEVITVANSWISTSEAISQVGATPVFVDIEPSYYTIDAGKIEERITSKTKAIIPVHLYGHPADMDPIVALCKKYNLKLIEDCAQAHLAEYRGKKVGVFGDAATFSFYPGKNLGAYGDAGCITTNSEELAQKCKMIANHGMLTKHEHKMEGVNSRLDGIQAAILSAKLPYLERWTEARRKIAKTYIGLLGSNEFLEMPEEADYARHVFHLFVVRVKNRSEVKRYLENLDIGTSIHYPTPLPFLDPYKKLGYGEKRIPVAADYSDKILSLPMYPELDLKDQEWIKSALSAFN